MIDPAALVRPDLRAIQGYSPTAPLDVLSARLGIPVEQLVKLDTNENPYGPSPRAVAAVAAEPHYGLYPDPEQMALRTALSRYTGQPTERIVCGNGADELIDLLIRLFVAPGEVVVDAPPTFGLYGSTTRLAGGRILEVPRLPDWSVPLDALMATVEREQAKLVFLPSPNNPDGTLLPRADVMRLLDLRAIVVVDEAYVEFSGGSVIDLVGEYPNLVVLRTFSKWAGLAGLRIGYGVMHETIAHYLLQIKPPFNTNRAAHVAAIASLADLSYLQENVARIVAERERLFKELQNRPGLHVLPSQANFLLIRMGERAQAVKQALERRGVLVRDYPKPPLSQYLRVTVGTPEQNDRLLAALDEAGGRV